MDEDIGPVNGRVLLGSCIFDMRSIELRNAAGQLVALRAQTMSVLECLAKRAGRLVSKSELFQSVWPGVVVTDDSLVQCIGEIRRAVGDHDHRVIQTAQRRGYRLQLPSDGLLERSLGHDAVAFRQEIGFARTSDDVSIAYGVPVAGAPSCALRIG